MQLNSIVLLSSLLTNLKLNIFTNTYISTAKMTVRWGMVGAGKICNDFVNSFNSYRDTTDHKIVGVAARDKKNAQEFANIHNIEMVFDSYDQMACSKDTDVVYIGTLNPFHYEHAKMCLENGKHVLCEKPLCMNAKQVNNLINLAKSKQRFLMEGVWSRFSPAYLELEKQMAESIGQVKFLEVNLGIYCESNRVTKKEFGGSAVLDVGIYVLQLSQFIFKEAPIRVTAIGSLNDHGVDCTETIVLEYGFGRRAVLNTHTQLEMCNQATVYGTNGRITLQAPFHFPTRIKIHEYGQDEKVKDFPLPKSQIQYNFENSEGLVYEALEVTRCIQQGLIESPRMTHKESLLLAKLEDSVRQQLGVKFDSDD